MGGQGLCSVTADGNKNFNNHKSGRKTLTDFTPRVFLIEIYFAPLIGENSENLMGIKNKTIDVICAHMVVIFRRCTFSDANRTKQYRCIRCISDTEME